MSSLLEEKAGEELFFTENKLSNVEQPVAKLWVVVDGWDSELPPLDILKGWRTKIGLSYFKVRPTRLPKGGIAFSMLKTQTSQLADWLKRKQPNAFLSSSARRTASLKLLHVPAYATKSELAGLVDCTEVECTPISRARGLWRLDFPDAKVANAFLTRKTLNGFDVTMPIRRWHKARKKSAVPRESEELGIQLTTARAAGGAWDVPLSSCTKETEMTPAQQQKLLVQTMVTGFQKAIQQMTGMFAIMKKELGELREELSSVARKQRDNDERLAAIETILSSAEVEVKRVKFTAVAADVPRVQVPVNATDDDSVDEIHSGSDTDRTDRTDRAGQGVDLVDLDHPSPRPPVEAKKKRGRKKKKK